MSDEMVTVFVARCPLGDQCSKKFGILAKKLTVEEAREAVAWHLKASPYHEMSQDDATAISESAEIDTWEEKKEM